jgi:SulP family sulfate permease
VVLARHPDGTLRDAEVNLLRTCNKISIIRFDGSLYFANTGYFEDKVLERASVKKGLQYIIIDAEAINSIDATGEEMLHSLAERLKANGIELLFARTKKQIMDVFRKTGFVDVIGNDHFFRLRTHAMQYAFGNMGNCDAEYCCPLQMHVPVDEELQEEKRLQQAAKAEKGNIVETFE